MTVPSWVALPRLQVVVRRERLCVAVKAGRQGDLPKGSLNLASSSTGATFYMDPAPTVPLNNAEAALAGEEAAEEAAILARLSEAVAGSAARIRQVREVLVFGGAFDICTCHRFCSLVKTVPVNKNMDELKYAHVNGFVPL